MKKKNIIDKISNDPKLNMEFHINIDFIQS